MINNIKFILIVIYQHPRNVFSYTLSHHITIHVVDGTSEVRAKRKKNTGVTHPS